MIEDSLRVLLVEDLASDAELELRELQRSGLTFDARIVETEVDFRRELNSFEPDIILSDFSLPRFSGTAALAIAREQRSEQAGAEPCSRHVTRTAASDGWRATACRCSAKMVP